MIQKPRVSAALALSSLALVISAPTAIAGEKSHCALKAEAGESLTVMLTTEALTSTTTQDQLAFKVSQKRAGEYNAQSAVVRLGSPEAMPTGDWKMMSTTLQAPLCLKLTDYQAIGVVYTKPEGGVHYNRYLEETAPALESVGGSIAARLADPGFESNIAEAAAPYKVSLVNWTSADGPDQYLDSDGFKAALPIFNEGVEVIEWFDLRLVTE